MSTDTKKKIRLALTTLVVLVGGYYIQHYSIKINPSDFAERASGDWPPYAESSYNVGGK